jgi:general transcription factor 3C polypeptide 5 (transcription factor C subunit 1)
MPSANSVPIPSESAPWFRIPNVRAVSVEHPCLVKNVDKAIKMLGGGKAIKTFLHQDHTEKPINLSFHPDDPFNKPILSINCQTKNVLLAVTVPKRTGRKRKRGSADPFVEDLEEPPPKKSASYLLESLRANEAAYQIEPVASIPSLHIFRTMPDFTYSTSPSPFLDRFRSTILSFQYPLLQTFQLDPARGLENTEIIPPPVLSTMAYPSNYSYRQNPAIKSFIDPTTGSRRLYNTQAPLKIHTQKCQWDTPTSQVPTTISPSAPPLEAETHNFRGLVTILRTIFARRPIWTRRGLANQFPPNAPIFLAKYAVAYVAYAMRSGPWRDCYVRLGVDPRSDPSYRKYQSLMLQLISSKKSSLEIKRYGEASSAWRVDPDKESHIFTGNGRVPVDGRSWQLCDLHDPILKQLVEIPDLQLRETCEYRYFGWYQNGTWCKLKIMLKAKLDFMLEEIPPPEGGLDSKFDELLKLPESYSLTSIPDEARLQPTAVEDQYRRETPSLWKSAGRHGDPLLGFLPRNASKVELEWAAQYRALCRAPQGKLPKSGRLTKSKAEIRGSFLPDGEGATTAALDATGCRVGVGSGARASSDGNAVVGVGDEGRGSTAGITPHREDVDGTDDELELELEEEDEDDAGDLLELEEEEEGGQEDDEDDDGDNEAGNTQIETPEEEDETPSAATPDGE